MALRFQPTWLGIMVNSRGGREGESHECSLFNVLLSLRNHEGPVPVHPVDNKIPGAQVPYMKWQYLM
jgi:hypothetical protein